MQIAPLLIALLALKEPASVSLLLTSGDSAFCSLRYDEALDKYSEVLKSDEANAGALWRLARLKVAQGEVLKKEKAERMYRDAADCARKSIQADSTTSEGHTWLAVSLGEIAMFEGSKTKIQLCSEIKNELDKALALNPRDDVAWSIRGSFYRALGNVSWIEKRLAAIFLGKLPDGGYEEAEQSLLAAIRIAPDVFRHKRELGLLYLDWGRKPEAKRALQESLETPTRLASDADAKARVRELLASLE